MKMRILIGILLTVCAVVGAWCWYIHREHVELMRCGNCIGNLIFFGHAKEVWAIKNNATNGQDVTWDDLAPYVECDIRLIKCMSGGTYDLGPIGTRPRCSLGGDHVWHSADE
jgi:hypothetical protein